MGWGFKLKNLNPFSKKGLTSMAYGLIGGPTMYMGSASDKFRAGLSTTAKGLGNLVTGGYIAQSEATQEAEKARDEARKQYADATAAAEAEAERIANLEEEKKKRLMLYGTQQPETLMGSYLGVQGAATVGRATLG